MYNTSMKLSLDLSRSCTNNFCRDTARRLFVNANRCHMRFLPFPRFETYDFINQTNSCAVGAADAGEEP
jgi:hypothetical protein